MKSKNKPAFTDNVFMAEGSIARGDITARDRASIWFNVVMRTEGGSISIGEGTNIQDHCTLHTDVGESLHISNYVTIGHNSVIHNKKIGENSLIGMGSILLSGAQIGSNCIIGAGSLVKEGAIIPDGEVWFGSPAQFRRKIRPEEIEQNRKAAEEYIKLAREYMDGKL